MAFEICQRLAAGIHRRIVPQTKRTAIAPAAFVDHDAAHLGVPEQQRGDEETEMERRLAARNTRPAFGARACVEHPLHGLERKPLVWRAGEDFGEGGQIRLQCSLISIGARVLLVGCKPQS
jgi:hypothetical protein